MLLGPLTGPLTAGLVFSLRDGRPFMAAVYALGVAEVALGLPALLAKELAFLAHTSLR
jgi:hypothetical protein